MPHRAWSVDLAAILLLGWAGVLAYVSVPTLLGDDPFWDGGISLLGAVVSAAHLGAAIGVFWRRSWGRSLGLAAGGIGLVGTGIVLLTLAANRGSLPVEVGRDAPLVLGIPAGMFATYLVVFLILWRAGTEFPPPSP